MDFLLKHYMAAARRFQRPQHNGEEQDQSLARARPAEQEQIPDRPPDQFQRRPLVFSKFKNIRHKSNPISRTKTQRHKGNPIINHERHEMHEKNQKTESANERGHWRVYSLTHVLSSCSSSPSW